MAYTCRSEWEIWWLFTRACAEVLDLWGECVVVAASRWRSRRTWENGRSVVSRQSPRMAYFHLRCSFCHQYLERTNNSSSKLHFLIECKCDHHPRGRRRHHLWDSIKVKRILLLQSKSLWCYLKRVLVKSGCVRASINLCCLHVLVAWKRWSALPSFEPWTMGSTLGNESFIDTPFGTND